MTQENPAVVPALGTKTIDPAAPPVIIELPTERGWRRRSLGAATVWFKGWPEGSSLDTLTALVTDENVAPESSRLSECLARMHGHFALVVVAPGWACAVVDRVRSIPLIWGRGADGFLLAQEAAAMIRRLGLGPANVDPDAALAIGMSGFTIGNDTVYRRVHQVGPGEFALFRHGASVPELGRYHRFEPWRPVPADHATLRRRLSRVTLDIYEKLIAEAAGRPIAIPLSAGRDSRLVASALVHLGYRNVLCFAFGLAGNHEAKASQRIAHRLGLPWRFVRYTPARLAATFRSDDYLSYQASADSLTGIHFPQDYLAFRALGAEGFLPSDALVVNGQSGDFITGNHVPAALHQPPADPTPGSRQARLLDAFIIKHFKQWKFLQTPKNLARIRTRLSAEIESLGGMPTQSAADHGIYEWCEFQDRQSKYVVNGQRLYEYLGYDWRLPLWDDTYLDFWQTVPLAEKRGQSLFIDMLRTENWGDVWHDIPINAKTLRPLWLPPIRSLVKVLHAPLGAERWHAFEKRYLDYYMGNLCAHAIVPYRRVAWDGRGHATGLAFHIEAYLAEKGLGLDGHATTPGIGA